MTLAPARAIFATGRGPSGSAWIAKPTTENRATGFKPIASAQVNAPALELTLPGLAPLAGQPFDFRAYEPLDDRRQVIVEPSLQQRTQRLANHSVSDLCAARRQIG